MSVKRKNIDDLASHFHTMGYMSDTNFNRYMDGRKSHCSPRSGGWFAFALPALFIALIVLLLNMKIV
jgi:hypothetical protein